MNIYDELKDIPEDEQKQFLSLGVNARYAANSWLPGCKENFCGIRIIQKGEVEVCAIRSWRNTPIQRYGVNETLGIRALMRPDAEPKLAWRAVSDVKCLEFDGQSVRKLIRQPGSELRVLFEHVAHVRNLDITMALHPLFRTLSVLGRQVLFDNAHPLALAANESLPSSEEKDLYFITQGSFRSINNTKVVRKAGETIYTRRGEDWVAESWAEAMQVEAQYLESAAKHFPLFGEQLKIET